MLRICSSKDLQSFTGDIESFSNSSTEELLLKLLKGMQNDLVKVKNQCFGYELLIFRLMHFANKLLIKQMYTLKTSENFLFPVFKRASEQDELHNIEVKDALEAFYAYSTVLWLNYYTQV